MPIRVYYEVLNQKGTPALYSDNYAQRPAAGYTGRIFCSPDTGQIFYDTGTTWTLLADAGVGGGSLASVCANGNTTATGIVITAGGLSTNSLTSTNLTAGSIPFIGTGGLFDQDNSNLFWDNTNKWLGLNTNTPTAPFDIHTTANVGMQINNTTTADSKIAFLNASVGKWRIGNLYSAGSNLFHIYNNTAGNNAMTITSGNVVTFTGTTITNSYFSTAFGINLSFGGVIIQSGQTAVSGISQGIILGLDSGVSQQLYFPTGSSYIYTYPSATGTLVNATSFTSGVIPKYSATAGVLTASMLSDDGTTLVSSGATRSNLYLKAVNNTYYSQLAFTNGSNGSYGGISYNNSGQYMQFETNSSEWARLYSNGNFLIGTTSDNGNKLQVSGNVTASGYTANANTSGGFAGLTLANAGSGAAQIYLNNSAQSWIVNLRTDNWFSIYNNTSATSPFIIRSDNGNIGINGGTSSTVKLYVKGDTGTSSTYAFATESGGLNTFLVRGDGLIQTGTSANSPYNASISGRSAVIDSSGTLGYLVSTRESKGNIQSLESVEWINKLNPVSFNYRKRDIDMNYTNDLYDYKSYGFIADEVEKVNSDLVFYSNYEDGTKKLAGVEYNNIIAVLVKAVQELNKKIENLN